ncbi:OmpA family protein [Hyphomicrobium sp.]|uniref:OmpA family protein n=1 Tax=Hyphomicrobium sp. TaxID=82 RepID=UPI0025C21561|nr:OmpA family protein [Hyphomicrobium sp.]MCC7253929.1 OmpA family protein [Hyphomicrobium sp.]
MLGRVALTLLLLLVSGAAALLAAGHLGINLPWTIAVTDQEPASKDREAEASTEAAKTPEKAVEETVAALDPAPNGAPPADGQVSIDISRISPDGASVFAGRAEPDSYVTVLENGKPAGTAKVDSNGEWSLSTEYKFASVDPKLSYEVSRTPPPEPPKAETAARPTPPPSAASVAGEVMRKFENLVEEAREEAKKGEQDKKNEETAAAPQETGAPRSESAPPDVVAAAPQAGTGSTAPSSDGPRGGATVTVDPDKTEKSGSAGVQTDAIPVPIMFVYNQATLTPDGERAAALLLEYLTLKRLNAVELTGHADERGSDAYNYDLSRERLEAVARILKDGGYAGELTLLPKGKTEPYKGVDRSAYRGEALYQLDRRVELRVAR